jgi:hypothetical protein
VHKLAATASRIAISIGRTHFAFPVTAVAA